MVWNQYRRIDAGAISVEELDMSIEITSAENAGTEFDVSIWNLTESTWRGVSEGDECRVVLGWEDGDRKSVVHGEVKKKSKTPDKTDTRFRLKGVDTTDESVKRSFSRTFSGKRPDQIAHAIAGQIGLTTGEIEPVVNGRIDDNWVVTSDRPARYWLDELVREAEARSEYAWEWFVDTGKFYFVQKDGRKEDTIVLSYENTLLSIGEASGSTDAEEPGLDFTAMCEPLLRRGGAVIVDTDDYSGAYKLTEYTYRSDTTTGEHEVSGHLAPLGVNYRVESS
ncbi:hypothetical protein HUG10_21590 (plasmid) [Halorarum halophilum]|uniref:Phage late control gene D protein (GPD) n=1 Tax=Halorarum halophilum TaxID=2743090 RepID=A0A7D5GQ86_9EURY|nr:hypothetical protein [Halobaculum halophilum]QLG30184.1 hypothetical protein HUG10_21590 [Halobaculum halophilum]